MWRGRGTRVSCPFKGNSVPREMGTSGYGEAAQEVSVRDPCNESCKHCECPSVSVTSVNHDGNNMVTVVMYASLLPTKRQAGPTVGPLNQFLFLCTTVFFSLLRIGLDAESFSHTKASGDGNSHFELNSELVYINHTPPGQPDVGPPAKFTLVQRYILAG